MRVCVALAFLCACSNNNNQSKTFTGGGTSGGTSGGSGPSFTITDVTASLGRSGTTSTPNPCNTSECQSIAGGQGDSTIGLSNAIAFNGRKVAFATIEGTGNVVTSEIGNGFGPTTETCAQEPTYNIWYAESPDGVTFTSTLVDTVMYAETDTQVGVALDASGNPTVVYLGGLVTDECTSTTQPGAGNLIMKRWSGSGFGAALDLATGSQSAGLNSTQNGCTSEDVCDAGDVTGFFPAVAVDSSGTPLTVFRDIHFGSHGGDDLDKSDDEFLRGTSANQFITADQASGGGIDNRIAVLPNGNAAFAEVIASSSGEANPNDFPGVYVGTEVSALDWTITNVFNGEVGSRLGFAVDKNGRYSLAYYDSKQQLLEYIESTDGTTWSAPVDIDTAGTAGLYPSLALDDSGEPAIAYYRCSSKVEQANCDAASDGLRVARRGSDGTWSSHDVSNNPDANDGTQPALGFVSGKEVVVFQSTTYDPSSGTSTIILNVAKEQ